MLLIPAIIMTVVIALATGHTEAAGTWAGIPAIVGIAGVLSGGVELGIILTIVMTLLGPLAIVAGATPITGAALMALMCLMVGRLSRFGLHKATMLVPIMIAWPIIAPPFWGPQETVDRTNTTFLGWMAVVFLVGTAFPVIVVPLLMRKRVPPKLITYSRSEAISYTVMITVLASISTFYVLDHTKEFAGAFLVATILVLAPIGDDDSVKPTLLRIAGTVVGSVFVVLIVTQIHSLNLIYLIGLLFGVAAVMSKLVDRTWVYYVLMVPTTACLNAYTSKQVGQLGEQRVVDNIVGGLLVLAAMAVAYAYARWKSEHNSDATPLTPSTPVVTAGA